MSNAVELKVKNFLEQFKQKDIYNYALTLSPVFKEPDRYIDYRKNLAQLLIAVPKLAEYDPKSLIYATAKAYEQGYSFDPKDAEAYFIPYGKDIQFQKGYRGVMKDLMKRPDVVDIIADVVYEADDIEIDKDKAGRLVLKRHKPNIFNRKKDKIIGAYAFIYYKIDGEKLPVSNGVVMSADEIEEEFRSLSKADKSMGKNSFWEKWKIDMYKKTVIKQLRKILPPLPEEKQNTYEQLNHHEEIVITEQRKELVKAFNEAYSNSGITAPELKSIIYTRYLVYEPAQLRDEELAELTKLLEAKGRSLLDATRIIGKKEEKELEELFGDKQLNEEQRELVQQYLGIDTEKKMKTEEFHQLKEFLSNHSHEEIVRQIGWKPKKFSQKEIEEAIEAEA